MKKTEKSKESGISFEDLMNETGNEYSALVCEGIEAGDVSSWIDTGSYSFNALLSGSIYGGLPSNRVTALAGAPSTGKTFYALSIVRRFLEMNPDGFVFYFESESALSKDMVEARDIDSTRMAILPVETIEQFRTQCLKLINKYLEIPKNQRKPIMMVLDSLGNLSTSKEMTDIAKGSEKRDMTRAQLVRGAFRTLTLKLGRANVPLIVTNHVYDVIGSYIPMKKMGAGDGLPYAASIIIFLTKKKDTEKEDGKIVAVNGAIITCHTNKSRLTVEEKRVTTLLNYHTGLNRYYGLLPLAISAGIFKKFSTKYTLPDGTAATEKEILRNPEKYYTEEILDQINEYTLKEFLYGGGSANNSVILEDDNEEEKEEKK